MAVTLTSEDYAELKHCFSDSIGGLNADQLEFRSAVLEYLSGKLSKGDTTDMGAVRENFVNESKVSIKNDFKSAVNTVIGVDPSDSTLEASLSVIKDGVQSAADYKTEVEILTLNDTVSGKLDTAVAIEDVTLIALGEAFPVEVKGRLRLIKDGETIREVNVGTFYTQQAYVNGTLATYLNSIDDLINTAAALVSSAPIGNDIEVVQLFY